MLCFRCGFVRSSGSSMPFIILSCGGGFGKGNESSRTVNNTEYSSPCMLIQIQTSIWVPWRHRYPIPAYINTLLSGASDPFKTFFSGRASVYNCFRCLSFPMRTCIGNVACYLISSHTQQQLKTQGEEEAWQASLG